MDMIRAVRYLRGLRREKGMIQEQLAEQLGVTRRTVSRRVTGNNMPDLDILIKLSDLYGVDHRQILNGKRDNEKMNEDTKEIVLQPR